ncbi:histone deacetylase HDT3 isoform X2 [Daucus carota subsp. sativus]|uniref:histone deacetylase HDT3 isoform X2 n=1 Tax=Daucus carota subsp. sativus TaxID=79200 RepID=UPI0007EFD716|nr:PREDICTED: histone deacetylase HDT3-like isoform X2 [Daucus carota subsp. sativus]
MKSKFWGVQVKGKKSEFVCPGNGELIRICQIALGDENFESVEHVVVYLIVDGKKVALARLSGELPQLSVDIVIETNFRLLHNWKEGRVDLCGYIVNEEVDEAADGEGEPPASANSAPAASEPPSSAKSDDSDDDHVEDFYYDEPLEKLDDEDIDKDLVDDSFGFDDDYLDEDQVDNFSEDETQTPEKVEFNIEVPQRTDGKKRSALTESPCPAKKLKKDTAAEIPESIAEFPCQLCNKTFKLEKGLECHIKAKHEEASAGTTTSYRSKKFLKNSVELQLACEFCNKLVHPHPYMLSFVLSFLYPRLAQVFFRIFKSEAGLEDHSKAKHGKE